MSASQFVSAFLLHRRDYSNSSLLVECFTRDEGRFPAIAKGVKGRGKGAAGMLQPFTPLQIQWQGRGEVKTLTRYEQAAPALRLEGKALYCGFYINELVMRLLQRNDPHEQLFIHYERLLDRLSQQGIDEAQLRYFELDMLNELGYGIDLDQAREAGQSIAGEGRYQFLPEQGLVPSLAADDLAISGSTLQALQHRTLSTPRELRESRALLRTILSCYLGEKPLKSRELFRHVFKD